MGRDTQPEVFQARSEMKIFVAGHKGLAGSAIVRALKRHGFENLVLKTRQELDLRDKSAVFQFFKRERPEIVFLAAARVGGIGANSSMPVEFLVENLEIQTNTMMAAAEMGVKKFINLGSTCIYPREATYPITEDQLLAGPFEQTNEAYALAKVSGIRLGQYLRRQYGKNFISAIPTNLYGPNDYYDLENSHVIPAMVLKVLRAKNQDRSSVMFWGTGSAQREFLHSDDLGEALVLCLQKYNEDAPINIGSSNEMTIRELAHTICRACEFNGQILWDTSKPDGVERKVSDTKRIKDLGWSPKIDLEEGIRSIVPEAATLINRNAQRMISV